MTQRVSNFDIRSTKTQATYSTRSDSGDVLTGGDGDPLETWHINGSSSFSSATYAYLAISLARTPEGGISAFIHLKSRRG